MTLHILTLCINTFLLIHLLSLTIYLLIYTSHHSSCQLSAQGEWQTDARAFKYLYKFNVHQYSQSNNFIFKCHILALSTSRHIYLLGVVKYEGRVYILHVNVHSVSSGHIISCKRKFHFTAGVLACYTCVSPESPPNFSYCLSFVKRIMQGSTI